MHTRFAPSPTGYLHIGNMRTALLCFLYARRVGGRMTLRIDDTDTARSKEEYVEGIKRDLSWMGVQWDDMQRQSERLDRYAQMTEALRAQGRIYACYETEEELDIKRKMRLSRGLPPIYDREGARLTDVQRAEYEAQGRRPHYRFALEEGEICWDDEVRGVTSFDAHNLSDPIIIRENGLYTYMLPSCIDDVDMGITHVLRGEDHVSNTAVQIQMIRAIGGEVPRFAHNALIRSGEGKLSKRKGSASIRELRADGLLPLAIASFLAKAGTSDAIDLAESADALIEQFDIGKFGRSPTTYSLDEVVRLNEKLLHKMSLDEVRAALEEIGADNLSKGLDEGFWQAVRPNIMALGDLQQWLEICNTPITPLFESDNDRAFCAEAARMLPDGEWDSGTWKIWTDAVKDATGCKGRALFMPLRRALTAMDHGPELANLLPLLRREKAYARLLGEAKDGCFSDD